MGEVMLSYSVSTHKSLGSDFPAVVIPVMTQHYTRLERNLLYTGVTQGRKLVGQEKAVANAVRGVKDKRRWSKLGERLAAGSLTSAQVLACQKELQSNSPGLHGFDEHVLG